MITLTKEGSGEAGSRRGFMSHEWYSSGFLPMFDDLQDVNLDDPGSAYLERLATGHPVWTVDPTSAPGDGGAAELLGVRSVAAIPSPLKTRASSRRNSGGRSSSG